MAQRRLTTPDGAAVISIPYRIGTTSIDVAEYQKCMLDAEKAVEDTANLMGQSIWISFERA